MDIEKAMDRIRKLLRTSRSSNEHEAALAAARAAELMAEFELTEAELRVEDTERKAEPIERAGRVYEDEAKRRRRSAWREAVIGAVASSFGCRWYLSGGRGCCPRLFGRLSMVQAATYTSLYLMREIERICEETWRGSEGDDARAAGQQPKRWRNAFRIGAAHRVAERLAEQRRATAEQRMAQTAAARDCLRGFAGDTACQALVLVERDAEEVRSEYTRFSATWTRRARGIGSVRCRSGYDAGREAGARISLGGAKGGLPASKERLQP